MIERYSKSVEPAYTDGRDIDPEIGELLGEGAQQISDGSADKHIQQMSKTWEHLPEPDADDPTYYDRPLLQESVWSWAIPVYYYVGGLSGASMALAAAVTLKRDKSLDEFIHRCHVIGFIGTVVSGALLIYDLGRPMRFLNMLRVFRPTSPMNMGAWILSATGGTAFMTVTLRRMEHEASVTPRVGRPLKRGLSGAMFRSSTLLTGVSLALSLWPDSTRKKKIVSGVCGTIGSLLMRFSVEQAGKASARDPRASFHGQRQTGMKTKAIAG